MSLKVFITGGTTGIGLALALRYLEAGAIVAVSGRSQEKFQAIANTDLHFYQADVANRESMQKHIKDFIDKAGGLDIIVANAGIGYSVKASLPNFEESRRIFDVNIFGVLNVFEPAIEYFVKKQQGHIVAMSSIAGFNGLPGTSAYSASKAAVSKLMESYAIDFKRQNISVTCIHPGFVDTPLTQRNDHPMPFMISADVAAEKFFRAIEKKKNYYCFPPLFSLVVRFFSTIPRSWYIKLMSLEIVNYSKK